MPLAPEIQGLVDAMAADPDARPTHEQTPEDAREGYRLLGELRGTKIDLRLRAHKSIVPSLINTASPLNQTGSSPPRQLTMTSPPGSRTPTRCPSSPSR